MLFNGSLCSKEHASRDGRLRWKKGKGLPKVTELIGGEMDLNSGEADSEHLRSSLIS